MVLKLPVKQWPLACGSIPLCPTRRFKMLKKNKLGDAQQNNEGR